MDCPYENHDGPNCHKDYCECVGSALREAKAKSKARKVTASNNFFDKNKIPYQKTTTENIVTTEYWGCKYYVSLKTFLFRKEGTNNWVEKKKQFITLKTTLSFGKYKGSKMSDIIENDKKYALWLVNSTEYLFDTDVHNLIK